MIKTVLVNGASGVLGSQIALQTAVSGFDVIVYGRSDGSIERAKTKMESYIPRYKGESNVSHDEKDVQKAYEENVTFSTDLEKSAKEADLIIEAILEKEEAKKDFFKQLSEIDIPEETIFATNTSSLRPSNFMEATGRTDRFLALHFQNEIWKRNIAEVMGTSETSDEVVKTVEQFAKDIEMDPIVMKKEQPGYINNTLFIPFVNESLRLFGTGEGAPYDIDRAWMKATNSPQSPAPFSAIDIVGFGTPPEIAEEQIEKDPSLSDKDREGLKYAVRFLRDSIQLGRGGKVQGEGFYHYDDNKPEFLDDDFLEDYPDISIEDYGKETGDENKDKAIYLFTRVSTALITGALELYAKGAADVEDIDKVWRSSSQSDLGPFDLIKKIGADKVYDVLSKSFADIKDDPQKELHDKMLDALKENKF